MSKFSLSLVDRQICFKDVMRFLLIALLLGALVFTCVLVASEPDTPLGELKGKIVGIFGGSTEEEHVHQWIEATCKTPKHCSECGEREGTTLDHDWADATCETPKTCKNCQTPWGIPLGHSWTLVTCVQGKECKRCGTVEIPAPGHTYADATCTEPSKCTVCNTVYVDEEGNQSQPLGHKNTEKVVEATCTTEGYTALTCSVCENVEKTNVVPALGHKPVPFNAKPATCTEKGNEAGMECETCGFLISGGKTIMPTGHSFNVENTVTTPATCTEEGSIVKTCTKGCGYSETTILSALGHDYGEVKCGSEGACSREGCSALGQTVTVEHQWAPATCTTPATCRRENCSVEGGATMGEPIGHTMSNPTCMAPSTCINGCGYKLDDKIGHNLDVSYKSGVLKYVCSMCDLSYKVDTYYRLDGTGFAGMTAVANKAGYVTHKEGEKVTDYPVITNGYYELLKAETTQQAQQLQLWIPSESSEKFGFTSSNSAVGVLSFKINAYMDQALTMQFVDASGGGERWSADWCLRDKFFGISAPTYSKDGTTRNVVVTGWDNITLKEIDVTGLLSAADLFTGWFDVKIAIVLDPKYDTITLYYYIDGEFIGMSTKQITTVTNGINCIYVTGNSLTAGSGLMLDDVNFGYTSAGYWVFAEHEHDWEETERTDNTCQEGTVKYKCSCGIVYEAALPAQHTVVVLESREPSCVAVGLTTGKYCTSCRTVLIAQREIPMLEHVEEYVDVKRPTCSESGHTDGYRCAVCHDR